jgi:hypothetical protein
LGHGFVIRTGDDDGRLDDVLEKFGQVFDVDEAGTGCGEI